MTTIYFVRHGETDWNREGRLQGRTDTDLNPRGRAQAKAVAETLRLAVEADFGAGALAALPVYASPLKRTRQTADLLLEALAVPGLAPGLEPRLAEIGFGHWEGRTWPEIRARDPINHRDRERDRWHFAPPGGESYAGVAERVGGWLAESPRPCCVVSHGGVARVMMHLLAGLPAEQVLHADIWQGRVLRFAAGRMIWLPHPGHA
ncbi:MAG: histidine phosphatase family protein [Beijerinckiaceae bacterium]|nr:histidine phosphatase family protein [Beijerinckiaceae bacterium]